MIVITGANGQLARALRRLCLERDIAHTALARDALDITDGKAVIDVMVKPGSKGEKCYIPVIISKTGVSELVFNDFYVPDDCDVDIVAGCGIHNSGCDESRHDGIHTFHIGKNSKVR